MVGIGAVCAVGGVGGRTARDCGTRRCATMVQAHGQGRGAAACSSAKMLLPGCRGALWVSAARLGPRRGGGAARSFFGEDQEKQLQQMIQDAERAEQTNTEEEQFGESSFFFFGGGGTGEGGWRTDLRPTQPLSKDRGANWRDADPTSSSVAPSFSWFASPRVQGKSGESPSSACAPSL